MSHEDRRQDAKIHAAEYARYGRSAGAFRACPAANRPDVWSRADSAAEGDYIKYPPMSQYTAGLGGHLISRNDMSSMIQDRLQVVRTLNRKNIEQGRERSNLRIGRDWCLHRGSNHP